MAVAIILLSIFGSCLSLETVPGIHRSMSPEIQSRGFNIVYGDEDLTILNEVVNEAEEKSRISKVNLNEFIQPLPVEDVKCLMSVDTYCSKKMKDLKRILIHAVTDDCKSCTKNETEEAGKVVAAMLAHDKVAWKMFLTRTVLETTTKKEPVARQTEPKFKTVGKAEVVRNPRTNRYIMPGFKVRVKRYAMKKE